MDNPGERGWSARPRVQLALYSTEGAGRRGRAWGKAMRIMKVQNSVSPLRSRGEGRGGEPEGRPGAARGPPCPRAGRAGLLHPGCLRLSLHGPTLSTSSLRFNLAPYKSPEGLRTRLRRAAVLELLGTRAAYTAGFASGLGCFIGAAGRAHDSSGTTTGGHATPTARRPPAGPARDALPFPPLTGACARPSRPATSGGTFASTMPP